jgi:hypothetical protein
MEDLYQRSLMADTAWSIYIKVSLILCSDQRDKNIRAIKTL